uniref:Uncharacterized protein n=1 Tax=Rhizophora mucronata TaxID=61149 RepID=A0A2P2KWM2_RHIMU
MSILPTQSQGSNSSSSFNSDSLNPNSPNHGSAVDLLSSHLPRHFQSLQFSDPQSPPPASIAISGFVEFSQLNLAFMIFCTVVMRGLSRN